MSSEQKSGRGTSLVKKALKDLEDAKKSLEVGLYDQAVDTADKAVETTFLGWFEQEGVIRPPKKLPLMIKELERRDYTIPLKPEINRVRILRNSIRHRGYSAKLRDAKTAIGIVEKFVEKAKTVTKKVKEIKARKLKKRRMRKKVVSPLELPEDKELDEIGKRLSRFKPAGTTVFLSRTRDEMVKVEVSSVGRTWGIKRFEYDQIPKMERWLKKISSRIPKTLARERLIRKVTLGGELIGGLAVIWIWFILFVTLPVIFGYFIVNPIAFATFLSEPSLRYLLGFFVLIGIVCLGGWLLERYTKTTENLKNARKIFNISGRLMLIILVVPVCITILQFSGVENLTDQIRAALLFLGFIAAIVLATWKAE